MLNRVVMVGRTANEPKLRYSTNGTTVTTFRFAVDRPFKNDKGEKETDFFQIVTFKKLAETCAHNLNKGRLVAVEGRLQTRSFTAQDGSTRWVTEVVADSVRFVDWPREQQQTEAAAEGGELGDEWEDDEVPF